MPKAIKGKTVSQYPVLMKEWIWEKNGSSNPEKLLETSKKKVWWRCSVGHEYQMTIDSRTSCNKCPYCSGKRVLTGFNDLATTHPELLPEWDYEKNSAEGIEPTSVMYTSSKRVWWRCLHGHDSYRKELYKKVKKNGCQECNRIEHEKKLYEERFIYISDFEEMIATRIDKENEDFIQSLPEQYKTSSIINLIKMNYLQLVNYLLEKYGELSEDYAYYNFFTERYIQNARIKRTKDGLHIHHVDEYKICDLSGRMKHGFYNFEFDFAQKADRLVYTNILEHLLLHIKIYQEMRKESKVIGEKVSAGGVHVIIQTINDYYKNKPFKNWHKDMYEAIKNQYNEYIILLGYWCYIAKDCDAALLPTFMLNKNIDRQNNPFIQYYDNKEHYNKYKLLAYGYSGKLNTEIYHSLCELLSIKQ